MFLKKKDEDKKTKQKKTSKIEYLLYPCDENENILKDLSVSNHCTLLLIRLMKMSPVASFLIC